MPDITKLPKWAQELIRGEAQKADGYRRLIEGLSQKVDDLQTQLERRHSAERIADLDRRVLDAARGAIADAVKSELVGYQKPLSQICERVIADHEAEIYSLINDELTSLLTADEFRCALKTALNEKLARVLVARTGGELEKRVNELRARPEARAKITLAITRLVDELGNG